MTYNDKLSLDLENFRREEEILLKAANNDQVNDLSSAVKIMANMTAARNILAKKIRNLENTNKGLVNKIDITVAKNKDLFQLNVQLKEDIKNLKDSFLIVISKSSFVLKHQDKCKNYIENDKLSKLSLKLKNGEFKDSKTVETLAVALNELRESLKNLSSKTDLETKHKLLKLVDSYQVDSLLQARIEKEAEEIRKAEAKTKAVSQRLMKRRSTIKASSKLFEIREDSAKTTRDENSKLGLPLERIEENTNSSELDISLNREPQIRIPKRDITAIPIRTESSKLSLSVDRIDKKESSSKLDVLFPQEETNTSNSGSELQSISKFDAEAGSENNRKSALLDKEKKEAKYEPSTFVTEAEKFLIDYIEKDNDLKIENRFDTEPTANTESSCENLLILKSDSVKLSLKNITMNKEISENTKSSKKSNKYIKINANSSIRNKDRNIINHLNSSESTSRSKPRVNNENPFIDNQKAMGFDATGDLNKFQESLIQILDKNFKQSHALAQIKKDPILQDILNFQLTHKLNLRTLIFNKLKEFFIEKLNCFTQTEGAVELNDIRKSYSYMIKGLLLKQKTKHHNTEITTFEKKLPFIQKVYGNDPRDGKDQLKD